MLLYPNYSFSYYFPISYFNFFFLQLFFYRVQLEFKFTAAYCNIPNINLLCIDKA